MVYGTLKRGYGNHGCLEGATYIGKTTLTGNLCLVDLGPFPAAVPGPDTYNIIGEVYEINEAILKRCDRLEGYPSFYNRSVVETEFGESWIYHFNDNRDYREDMQVVEWEPRGRRA